MTRSVPLGGQGAADSRATLAVISLGLVLGLFALVTTLALIASLVRGHFGEALLRLAFAVPLDGLFAWFLCDYLPRRGSLTGSVLEVQGMRGHRQCDLGSAEVIRLRSALGIGSPGPILSPSVLFARQHPGEPAVRLMLLGPDYRSFPAEHLRKLAAAIGERPGPAGQKISKVVEQLNAMADQQERRRAILASWGEREDDWPEWRQPSPIVPDWSHRTGRPSQSEPAPPAPPTPPAPPET